MTGLFPFLDLRRLGRIVMLTLLGALAIALEVAPIGHAPEARPSPDLLYCVVAYWALRRPGSTLIVVVFGLGLMRDLISDVPTGAGALSLVAAMEALKMWRGTIERSYFVTELLAVTAGALLAVSIQVLAVMIMLAQPPYLTALVQQTIFTAMAYTVLVLIFRLTIRLKWRPQQGAF